MGNGDTRRNGDKTLERGIFKEKPKGEKFHGRILLVKWSEKDSGIVYHVLHGAPERLPLHAERSHLSCPRCCDRPEYLSLL
jgi:hypothetical protein